MPVTQLSFGAKLAPLLAVALALGACGEDGLGQLPDIGDVDGFVCDPANQLAASARIIGQGRSGDVEARTDGSGFFTLEGLLAGSQQLAVVGDGFTDVVAVEVVADTLTHLEPPACLLGPHGTITGQVCGISESLGSADYWVSGADVYVEVGAMRYATTSRADGAFVLRNVPAGDRTLHIEKGSFSTTIEVEVREGAITTLDPVCIGDSVRVVVVTGVNDSIETRLFQLGLKVRDCIPAELCWELDPAKIDYYSGAITLVDGVGGAGSVPAFMTDLLDNATLLAETDMIFFNCGLTDSYLASAPAWHVENLRGFVQGGGSIYVSDYAYELIRWAMPEAIDFWGNDGVAGAAKVGVMGGVTGAITDDPRGGSSLGEAIGKSSVAISYNKPNWVVMTAQQRTDVRAWVKGTAKVETESGQAQVADLPLLVTLPYGSGKVMFTTFHVHEQATGDMLNILTFMIFQM